MFLFLLLLFFCFFTSNCQQERKHTTSIDWLWIFNYFSAPTTSDCRASPTTLPETCRRLPTTSDDLLPHLHHNGCWIDPCYYSSSRWNDSSRCPVQVMSFQSMLSSSKSQQLSSRAFKKILSCFSPVTKFQRVSGICLKWPKVTLFRHVTNPKWR